MPHLFFALLMVLLSGCTTPGTCVPGQSAACACPDGNAGAQACLANGTFSACQCEGAPPRDLGGDLPDARDLRNDLSGPPADLRPAMLCASSSPCWESCGKGGNNVSYCKIQCGVADGVDCWQQCSAQGNNASYCQSVCAAAAGCAQALCYLYCGKQGNGVSYCKNNCGATSKTSCGSCAEARSGYDQCWASCTAQGNGTSYCQSVCGM